MLSDFLDNIDKLYIISDNHFRHENIIKYCCRMNPETNKMFLNYNEMDDLMIKYWNSIKEEDYILHLGDFSFGTENNWRNILKNLNGFKYLIKGNHDKTSEQSILNMGFGFVKRKFWLNHKGLKILFTHKPAITEDMLLSMKSNTEVDYKIEKSYELIPNSSYEDIDLNVHGHIHNNRREQLDKTGKHFNASVEMINYTPIHINEIIRRMNKNV